MSSESRVLEALERWEEKGLLDAETVQRLRREAEEAGRSSERRWAQFALAATGAVVLVIAGFLFFSWIWPSVGPGGQSVVLAAVAVGGFSLGRLMESRDRWLPVAYMLQASGLALLLIATAHSEEAWDRGTAGGLIAGLVAVVAPVLAFVRSRKRNTVTPAMELALVYLGAFLLLHRATTVDHGAAVWIVDGLYLVALGALVGSLGAPSAGRSRDWVRNGLLTSLYCGLPLAFFTATESLDLDPEDAVFALDVWLLVLVLLGAWALRASESRAVGEHRLVASVIVLALILAFWTLGGSMDASDLVTALGAGAVGGAGLAYALPRRARSTILASCLALVAAALYYGMEAAGTLGVVVGLAVSAAILFVVSARLRSGGEDETAIR